jgi:hypothetical protein
MKIFIASLLSLILIVTTADAGPLLTWNYTVTFSGDRGNAYVDAGAGARMDAFSSTGMDWYQGYVALTAATALGTQSGSQTVVLGSTPGFSNFYWAADLEHMPPGTPLDNAPLPGGKLDALFNATITIKDISSGLDHTVSLTRSLVGGDAYLGTAVTLVGSGEDLGESFDLGKNHYVVKFHEAQGQNPATLTGPTQLLVADVKVSSIDTPEPTTLILGGIGLGGVFGARFRRRLPSSA